MLNLNDYNSEHCRKYWQNKLWKPRLNGVACPKCGTELLDSRPNRILTSRPPKKDVRCMKCGFTGYRVI